MVAQHLVKSEMDQEDWTLVDGVPTADYERVVRMASFLFILTAATVVVATGLWADHELAILIVLAIAGLSVLTIHDLLSPGYLGAARFIVEGPLAITLVALLVAFTGREWSPFFFAFPLIVAGAALVVEGPVTLLLAVGAGIGYLSAVFIRPPGELLSPTAVAGVALNLSAIILLAFVASVVARAQRSSRLEAIRLSTVDSLTGLFNRAYFFAAMEREIQRSARSGRGFCLLMMDLDGLKAVNDRFGHFNGDRALRTVARRSGPASAGSTRPPATGATSSSSCCPRRSRPARSCSPRRSASAWASDRSRWTGSRSAPPSRSAWSSTRATA